MVIDYENYNNNHYMLTIYNYIHTYILLKQQMDIYHFNLFPLIFNTCMFRKMKINKLDCEQRMHYIMQELWSECKT